MGNHETPFLLCDVYIQSISVLVYMYTYPFSYTIDIRCLTLTNCGKCYEITQVLSCSLSCLVCEVMLPIKEEKTFAQYLYQKVHNWRCSQNFKYNTTSWSCLYKTKCKMKYQYSRRARLCK